MKPPEISMLFTSDSGETQPLKIAPEDLITLDVDYIPTYVHLGNYKKTTGKNLRANALRHEESHWYDEEHRFLTDVLKKYPNLEQVIDEKRLLLEAVFVKQAHELQIGKPRTYRKDFEKKYNKFVSKWGRHPQLLKIINHECTVETLENYLNSIHSLSYFQCRNLVYTDLRSGRRYKIE